MKLSHLAILAGVGLVWWYWHTTRSKASPVTANILATPSLSQNPPAKATAASPANFSVVPELDPQTNIAITEAAYHQGSTEYSPAFGALENDNPEEVITLQ